MQMLCTTLVKHPKIVFQGPFPCAVGGLWGYPGVVWCWVAVPFLMSSSGVLWVALAPIPMMPQPWAVSTGGVHKLLLACQAASRAHHQQEPVEDDEGISPSPPKIPCELLWIERQ